MDGGGEGPDKIFYVKSYVSGSRLVPAQKSLIYPRRCQPQYSLYHQFIRFYNRGTPNLAPYSAGLVGAGIYGQVVTLSMLLASDDGANPYVCRAEAKPIRRNIVTNNVATLVHTRYLPVRTH